jgi:hypothetical protein
MTGKSDELFCNLQFDSIYDLLFYPTLKTFLNDLLNNQLEEQIIKKGAKKSKGRNFLLDFNIVSIFKSVLP